MSVKNESSISANDRTSVNKGTCVLFCIYVCMYACMHAIICVFFLIKLLERNVKVVLSLERQNSLILAVHGGLGRSIQSKAQSSHSGHDKCFSTLQERYSFPMMRDRIQMCIKYCEPC